MIDCSSFSFFTKDISFILDNQKSIENWILLSISTEDKSVGEITYIFCSDDYLYQMNLEYLKHDTYTDVITFNYCVDDIISGDIFISIDRIKDNAITFDTTFKNELHRVMIHAILHLIGYNDKKESEKIIMRSKEDFYLSLLDI